MAYTTTRKLDGFHTMLLGIPKVCRTHALISGGRGSEVASYAGPCDGLSTRGRKARSYGDRIRRIVV